MAVLPCPGCHECTFAPTASAHARPNLSYLAGNLGQRKRNIEELAEDLFLAPIAVGTVANLEQEVIAALSGATMSCLSPSRQ